MKRTILYALAASVTFATPSIAQTANDGGTGGDGADESLSLAQKSANLRAADLTNETALGQQTAGIVPADISVAASNDDSDVSLTFARRVKPGRRGFASGSLTLKAPLKEDKSEGSFFTQDGFAGKFSATGSVSIVRFGRQPASPVDATGRSIEANLMEQLDEACELDKRARDPKLELLFPQPVTPEIRQSFNSQEVTDYLSNVCQWGLVLRERKAELIEAYLSELDPDQLEDLTRAIDGRDIYFFNLAASIGYKRYSFLDPATFAEDKDTRVPLSFSASVGAHFSRNSPFVALGYEYKRDSKAADAQVICLPVAVGAPSNCKSGSFAGPQKDDRHSLFGVVRIPLITTGDGIKSPEVRRLILGLKVSRQLDGKLWGISAPLYFLLDKDGGMKGGIRFDWEQQPPGSKEDEARFSVFVSKSFDFLGK